MLFVGNYETIASQRLNDVIESAINTYMYRWNVVATETSSMKSYRHLKFFYGIGGGFKACPVCKIQIKGFYLFQLSFGQKCAAGPTTYHKQTVSMYINYT